MSAHTPQRFGNTWKSWGQAAVVGLGIGLVGYVVMVLNFIFAKGFPLGKALVFCLLMVPGPALAITVFVLPTVLFSLHIRGEWLEHRFLERYVIQRARLADFESFRQHSGLFAVVLNFKGGKHIHYIGGPDIDLLLDTMHFYAATSQSSSV